MAKEIIYWDSCVFISWLTNEKRSPAEMSGIVMVSTGEIGAEARRYANKVMCHRRGFGTPTA